MSSQIEMYQDSFMLPSCCVVLHPACAYHDLISIRLNRSTSHCRCPTPDILYEIAPDWVVSSSVLLLMMFQNLRSPPCTCQSLVSLWETCKNSSSYTEMTRNRTYVLMPCVSALFQRVWGVVIHCVYCLLVGYAWSKVYKATAQSIDSPQGYGDERELRDGSKYFGFKLKVSEYWIHGKFILLEFILNLTFDKCWNDRRIFLPCFFPCTQCQAYGFHREGS